MNAASLCRRYDQLFQSEKYYDCAFHFEDTTLKAHRLILCAASPVFEAMFYGPMREKRQEIKIIDISSKIFHILLRSIYCGQTNFEELDLESTIELYYGAMKYMLKELAEDCLTAIKHKLRFSNILPTLELCSCLNTPPLLAVCMKFLIQRCLSDAQYVTYLKRNYTHVSKKCIKMIISATASEDLEQLLWFVTEWCSRECANQNIKQVYNIEQFNSNKIELNSVEMLQHELLHERRKSGDENRHFTGRGESFIGLSKSIERRYFKACQPFVISEDTKEWCLNVTTDHFTSLLGIIIHSRLKPCKPPTNQNEYEETFQIEISVKCGSLKDGGKEDQDVELYDYKMVDENSWNLPTLPVVWRYDVKNRLTRYNCDVHVKWEECIVLSPDIEYQIKLKWKPDAYGAEYPCSLQSDNASGVKFRDISGYCGSIIKGLHLLNLV